MDVPPDYFLNVSLTSQNERLALLGKPVVRDDSADVTAHFFNR